MPTTREHRSPLARLRSLAEQHARAAAAAEPGTRFSSRFESRRHVPRLHPRRLMRLLLGLALLATGFANVFIPGPGGSVFILSSALVLSGESRNFARMLDRGELRFQRQIRWVLRRPIVATATISALVLVAVSMVGAQLR